MSKMLDADKNLQGNDVANKCSNMITIECKESTATSKNFNNMANEESLLNGFIEKNQRFQHDDYKETFRVLLNKVPFDLNEQGLITICTKLTGTRPIHCYKHQPEGFEADSWAVLEYNSHSQAEEAILKLNKHPILNLDAMHGQRRLERIAIESKTIACPLNSQKFADTNAFKWQHKEKEQPLLQKTVGRGYKLNSSGIATSNPDAMYFVDPKLNFFKDSDLPVDNVGDYMGGYNEAINSITHTFLSKTNLSSETNFINQKREKSLGKKDRKFDSQFLSTASTASEVFSTNEEINREGQYAHCRFCARVTSVRCASCGQSYCCQECLVLSKDHNDACEGKAFISNIWQKKFVYTEGPQSLQTAHTIEKMSADCGNANSQYLPKRDLLGMKLETTTILKVQNFILDYDEPTAFLCYEVTSESDTDIPDETSYMLGTVTSTKIPALDVWRKHLLIGKSINVRLEILKEEHIIANMMTGHHIVCQICLEPWDPYTSTASTVTRMLAAPDICGRSVAVSHFCCSNMCYVRPNKSKDERVRLALEIDFIVSNSDPIENLPNVGQIVLAYVDHSGKSFRARVKNVAGPDKILVHLIDIGTKLLVPLGCIYPISSQLLKIPEEAVLVELADVVDSPFTLNFLSLINNVTAKKTKFKLEISTDQKSALLIELESGLILNRKLKQALKYSWERQEFQRGNQNSVINNYSSESFLPDPEPLPEDRSFLLTILHFNGSEIICCKSDSPLLNCILRSFTELAEEYVEENPEELYIPKERVVLVQYTDGLWYRALVTNRNHNSIDVLFFDFGDSLKDVPSSKVRKLPDELNWAPALGTYATIAGFTTKDLHGDNTLVERLRQLLLPGTILEGTVLQQNTTSTLIFLPDLLQTLYSEGLISTAKLYATLDSLLQMKSKSAKKAALEVKKIVETLPLKSEINQMDCDFNQNYVHCPKTTTLVLQQCFEEVFEEVASSELQLAKDEEIRRKVCLKLNYFKSLQQWVDENERKLSRNRKHENDLKQLDYLKKGITVNSNQVSMMAALLGGVQKP